MIDEDGYNKVALFNFTGNCPGKDRTAKKPLNHNEAIIEIDFGIQGCAVQNATISDVSVPVSAPIPCYVAVPKGRPVGSNSDVFRIEGGWGNGISLQMYAGEDDDLDDEIITFDPTFTFVNSGGGFFESADLPAPDQMIAYDNDKPNLSYTNTTVYLEFRLEEFQVLEGNGPVEPVLRHYWLDDQGTERTGWYQDCTGTGNSRTCEELPQIKITPNIPLVSTDIGGSDFIDDFYCWQSSYCFVDAATKTVTTQVAPPPGVLTNTIRTKVGNRFDDLFEGHESFTVTIDESRLPNGFAVRDGDVTTATVTVFDDEVNDFVCSSTATLMECPTTVRVVQKTVEIAESGSGVVSVGLVASRDVPSTTFSFTVRDAGPYKLTAAETTLTATTALRAGYMTPVSLTLPLRTNLGGRGSDHSVSVTLDAGSGFEKAAEDNVDIWIRAEHPILLELKVPDKDAGDTAWAESDEDSLFFVEARTTKLFSHTAFDVPISVTRPDGTRVPPADYRIEIVGRQDNAEVVERPDGTYSLLVSGYEQDGVDNRECGGSLMFPGRGACLSFRNERGGTSGLDSAYDIRISLDDSDPRYGGTRNVAYEVPDSSAVIARTVQPIGRPKHLWTPRECFVISPNVPCGPSDGKIHIEPARGQDEVHPEEDVSFYFLSAQDVDETVRVRANLSGYHTGRHFIDVPPGVSRQSFSADRGDQVEVPLVVSFSSQNESHPVDPADASHSVAVADDEPTCWTFSENTGNRVNDEGGFVKIIQLAFDRRGCPSQGRGQPESGGLPKNIGDAIIEVDFGVSGCAVTNTLPGDSPVALSAEVPCYLNVPQGQPVGQNSDRFRMEGGIRNGFALHFKLGDDVDTDDEVIALNPQFEFINSGGGLHEVANSGFPDEWIAYDDDKPDYTYTSTTVYLEFSNDRYTVLEGNGPAQPVLHHYWRDSNGQKQTGWYQDCTGAGSSRTCVEKPQLNYTSPIVLEVTEDSALADLDFCVVCDGTETSPLEVVNKIPPGRLHNGGTFSIRERDDGLLEDSESFSVSIKESALPKGFAIESDAVTTTYITILDDDTVRDFTCPTSSTEDECATKVKVSEITSRIAEDHTGSVTVGLLPSRFIASTTFTFDVDQTVGSRLAGTPPFTPVTVTTPLYPGRINNVEVPMPPLNNTSTVTPAGVVKLTLQSNPPGPMNDPPGFQTDTDNDFVRIWVLDVSEGNSLSSRAEARPAAAEEEQPSSGDQPATPEISITSDGDLTEGGTAYFSITASPAPTADLTVGVSVSQNGDYGVSTGSQTVTIPTSGTYTLAVDTSDDGVDEADGLVTVTLDTGTGYTVSSSSGAATAAVADDDDPPATCALPSDAITVAEVTAWRDALDPTKAAAGIKRWNQVLAKLGKDTGFAPMAADTARQVANWLGNTRWDRTARTLEAMELCDSPPPQATPEISITASGDITEGGEALFSVRSDPAPTADLDVEVDISQNGDYTATGLITVTLATSGTATVKISTTDDSIDEADGTITATVLAGDGYTVSTSAGAASVVVSDNDDPRPSTLPTVAISDGEDYEDNVLIEFALTLNHASSSSVSVTLEIEEGTATYGGDFLGIDTVHTIPAGETQKTLYIPLRADSWEEPDETFQIRLVSATGATIGDGIGVGVILNDD